MKHCPYLFRRNGIYYFRRVFPTDLQSIIGRREIVRTLGTAHKKSAWRLAILMATELEQLFDRIREGIDLLSPEQQEIFIQDKRQEKTQTLMEMLRILLFLTMSLLLFMFQPAALMLICLYLINAYFITNGQRNIKDLKIK